MSETREDLTAERFDRILNRRDLGAAVRSLIADARAHVATLTAEVERLRAINQHDLAAWEQEAARADAAERDNERLTQERDEARLIADGHVGGLVSNLRARAEAAEARVLTAERERDEAKAKSAIDEAGYDSILTTAQALQARVTALEAAAAMAITAKKPARR